MTAKVAIIELPAADDEVEVAFQQNAFQSDAFQMSPVVVDANPPEPGTP